MLQRSEEVNEEEYKQLSLVVETYRESVCVCESLYWEETSLQHIQTLETVCNVIV